MVIDLHLVAVVHRHPGLARLDGDADEDAGVVVLVHHLVDDAEGAVAHRAGGPVEQAHASVGADESVLDGHAAGANVLPAIEVLAVEELDPAIRLGEEWKGDEQNNGESSESFHDKPPGKSIESDANCPQRRIMPDGRDVCKRVKANPTSRPRPFDCAQGRLYRPKTGQ